MSNINFRKTAKGYSADFQRRDGFGWERWLYRASDLDSLAKHYGWQSADEMVSSDGVSFAEMLIVQGAANPYRVVSL